jgi:hypothetical protein
MEESTVRNPPPRTSQSANPTRQRVRATYDAEVDEHEGKRHRVTTTHSSMMIWWRHPGNGQRLGIVTEALVAFETLLSDPIRVILFRISISDILNSTPPVRGSLHAVQLFG